MSDEAKKGPRAELGKYLAVHLEGGQNHWDIVNCHGEVVAMCRSEYADLEAKHLAAAPEMAAMLRELQWGNDGWPRCTICDGFSARGHFPGCRLAALLARIDGEA